MAADKYYGYCSSVIQMLTKVGTGFRDSCFTQFVTTNVYRCAQTNVAFTPCFLLRQKVTNFNQRKLFSNIIAYNSYRTKPLYFKM
jgi:hypothetical protein